MAAFIPKEAEEVGESDQNEMILFQCKSCNAVLADSSYSEGANSDLGLIVLRDVPETVVQVDRTEEDGEEDEGCDYSLLCCVDCDAEVGKFYRATTEELSILENRGTLELYRLKFHTLDVSKCERTPSPLPAPAEVAPTNQLQGIQDALTKLSSDIAKIQYVMCNFDERIQRMEKLLGLPAIEHQGLDTSADISVRSGNVTLNSSVSQRGDTFVLPPYPQGRADTSGRNGSVPNGHLDKSAKSDTFVLKSSASHRRNQRSDFGRTWNSDSNMTVEGIVSPVKKQMDMGKDRSFSRNTSTKGSFEPYQRREPDCSSDRGAQKKKPQKRKNTDSMNRSVMGKKQRNGFDE